MESKPEIRLLTTKQVASKLGVHYKLVLRWVRNLGLPSYRFGKEFRYREDEIDQWIEKFKHRNEFDPDRLADDILKRLSRKEEK